MDEELKEENFDLQLGDIIKLNAPSNIDLHDKEYLIKFINNNKIELINEEKTITLDINEQGNLLEESIENIIILYRNPSPSYIVQNNLTLNSNISIYFGEPLPKILNGKITNIEEDMIEITLFPSKDIIYIDFGYSGIPENLNIEKIVIRDKSITDEIEKEIEQKDEEQKEKDDESIYLDLNNVDQLDNDLLFNEDNEKVLAELNDTVDLDFDDEEFEVFHSVNVSEDEKRYSLEEQLNDFIDNRLYEFKKEELNNIVKNNVNLEALRYTELRSLYSNFDENNNANKPELNNEYFKPLKESLLNLNKKLYWLLPVVSNKKMLFTTSSDEEDINEDIINMQIGAFLEKLIKSYDNWSVKSSKQDIQNYSKYINDLNNIFETSILNYDTKNLNMEVNNQIHVINDVYNNFYSYVVKNSETIEERFVIDVYNNGLTMLEMDNINNKKIFKTKNLTLNDKISCMSFLTLPLPIFNFSKINMEYTSIYERSNLALNYLNYSKILNNYTNVNNYTLDDSISDNFKESHKNIHDDTIFENINYFNIGELINQESNEEKIDYLIESFIPTKMKIIAKVFETNKINNFSELINIIQCANIDINNMHSNDYKLINSFFDKNLKYFKDNYIINRDLIKKIYNSFNYNDVVKKDNYYGFNLLNKEIKADVFEYYGIKEDYINIEELYNSFLKIDNAKFFMNALNKNIMDLIVSNLLDNFIKQSKDLNVNDSKKSDSGSELELENDEKNCEKYYLSKKYSSLQELESDNNKLTYFDAIYDKTFYSIINDFENERKSMDSKSFFEFLTSKIMEVMNFTKKNALREAKAIMEEKKEIIDGDYALLIDKESNDKESKKNYIYIRKNNLWEYDEKFKDAFYIDSNKIFCDSFKECISDGEKCMSNDKIVKQTLKDDVNKVLENFEYKYNLSIEEIKGKINDNYEISKKYIKKIKLLNENNIEKFNKILLNYNNKVNLNIVKSPYEELRDYVLSLKDFTKKQEYIRLFCLKFTRNSINDEEPHWLYCIKTNIKLIPEFLLKLANAYITSNNYQMIIDTICATQGTISDDNNYWVDKYSGYIIKRIDFSSDEGYDEQGLKLITKEILENDYNMDFKNPKLLNPDINIITLLLKSITQQLGINISHHYDIIINNIIKIQSSSVPNKEQYEKMIKMSAKKSEKTKQMSSYEDVYNLSLLLLTLVFIVVIIQINIPSIKTKKTFPGCIKSFKGYPFYDNEDKTAITYIACIANKMKSSIKPWNTILKMSESTLVKKMDGLIEKFILTNPTVLELMQKKRDYLETNKENELISEDYTLEKWTTFMPPLSSFTINSETIQPLSSTFKDELLENITKGKKNNYIDTIESKIIYLSNTIIESIQKIVKKEAILLESNSGEPYLENACCNNDNNTINYFAKLDKTIIENNELIKNYSTLLYKLKNLKNPKILYDITNTKLKVSELKQDFSEETIYKSFIYYCNFENNIPLDDELKSVCMDKPSLYDINLSIDKKIELLKNENKVYNKSNLNELLDIINIKNTKPSVNNENIINNMEKIRLIIENYEKMDDIFILDEQLLNKLKAVIENHSYVNNKNTEQVKSLKNYLLTANSIMKNNVLEFAKTIQNFNKKELNDFTNLLDFDININNYLFFKEYIKNLLIIFPNIIINKNINYNKPPSHWELSELHNNDVLNIMKKYYEKINSLELGNEFSNLNKIVNNKCKIILELIEFFLYYDSDYYSKETKLFNIFDEELIEYFIIYCFNTIIYEFINNINSEQFKLETSTSDIYDENVFNRDVLNFLNESLNIMNNHYKLLNSNYKKVKEKVSFSKEKEKDLITDYLKNLTDEERELENLFKNNKLEKWSKGLQKGITQYVKQNYDEERDAIEKQALKEKLLNKKNVVTDMNKEIYMMELEEEMANEKEMDDEAYNMENIPDDDDVNSDYEYDY